MSQKRPSSAQRVRRRLGAVSTMVWASLSLLGTAGLSPFTGSPFTGARLQATEEALPPIVYVARTNAQINRTNVLTQEAGATPHTGVGELLLRLPNGQTLDLVGGSEEGDGIRDVMDPDVSYDGEHIVFSAYSESEAWRIWEIGVDGRNLRQITSGDAGGVDLDPCYMPDGRICFVSTRYTIGAPDGRGKVTNLWVVNADGTDAHRITAERFGGETPAIDPQTGLIVYSRWWLTGSNFAGGNPPRPNPGYYAPLPSSPGFGEGNAPTDSPNGGELAAPSFTGVNTWFLSSIRPDGTELKMWSGFRLDRVATMAYRPAFDANGDAYALFLRNTPFPGGHDANRGPGARLYPRGPAKPVAVGGPQVLIPTENSVDVPYLYQSITPLADGRLLTSAADWTDQRISGNLGVYVQTGGELVALITDDMRNFVDPVPVVRRDRPPVLQDRVVGGFTSDKPSNVAQAVEANGEFTFIVENLFANAALDVDIANAPGPGVATHLEFWMNPPKDSQATQLGVRPVQVTSVPIPPTGRVEVELPAGVPLFEVLRTADGAVPFGRDGQFYHVGGHNYGVAGETARCVGCHSGHSMQEIPEDTRWSNLAPGASVQTSSAFLGENSTHRADNTVDRSTDTDGGIWVSARETAAVVELEWRAGIIAREVVLYAPPTNFRPAGGQTLEPIGSLEFRAFSEGEELETYEVSEIVRPEGTRIELPWGLPIDRLSIEFQTDRFQPELTGRHFALAEVEVIGRGQYSEDQYPYFARGDIDCNGQHDLTDPISVLRHLFQGGSLCCEVAADADGDEQIILSDAIYLFDYFFRGGSAPTSPFPDCSPHLVEGELGCEDQSCS